MAVSDAETVIILNESNALAEALSKSCGTVYICNLSANEITLPGVQSFAGDGNAVGSDIIHTGGMGVFKR